MRVISRNVRALAIAAALLGTATAGAWAQIVQVQQPPNRIAGFFSDMDCDACGGPVMAAEDFVLTESRTIVAVNLWGAYLPDDVPVASDSFNVKIYEEIGGLPGAMLYFGGVSSVRTATGQHIDVFDEYKYELTLNSPKFLVAGTYFVEIFNNTVGSTESFLWEYGGIDPEFGLDGAVFATVARSGSNWARQPGMNLAFEVVVQAGACFCGDLDWSGGNVDLNDFATFATCFALGGTYFTRGEEPGSCDDAEFNCSDMNGSAIVDLDDFASFAVVFATTPTNIVPNCDGVED